MVTVAIFNIVVVLFAYLARYRRTAFLLNGSFVLIFLFLALRYDYGNDYQNYLEKFIEINRWPTIDYFDPYWNMDIGWIFLCRMFEPLGFFAMTAVLSLFSCLIYYRFIKKNVLPAYYWLAVFLYVFNPGFMLVHSSAMRQSLAITIFVFAIDYLYKKAAIRYFLCVALASLFHKSALILVPVFLLGFFNWKIKKITAVSLFSLFLFMVLFILLYGESLIGVFNLVISKIFGKYVIYEGGAEIGTGLSLIFSSFLFALVLFYERSQIEKVALLFKIVVFSYLFLPMGLLIMMIGRFGMYFQPATLVVFPVILFNIKVGLFRNLILVMLIFITLYFFYGFFQSDVWKDAFGTYQTIFSAPTIF